MLPLLVATIISTSVSNSSSGGVVMDSGNVTTGSSYSSVSVQTYSNGEGSTSTVNVKTDDNGKVNEQTITKTAPPGGKIEINLSTSTGNAHANVHTRIDASATSSAVASITPPSIALDTPHSFVSFFRRLFSFFRFSW